MHLSRRDTFGLAAGFLSLGLARARAGEASIGDEASLGTAAEKSGVVFGTSIAADTLANPAQAALYLRHARIFTVDYALKFGYLRPAADQFMPGDADAILAFAKQAGIPVRGHTLAWNESRPEWLMKLSTAEVRVALDRHIDETVAYYAGRLQSWDVVNEPFWPGHGLPGGYRDGPWLQAFGTGYIPRAFKRAERADPNCKLVLNEAMTEAWTDTGATIRAGLLRAVDELQHAGARLDAVGLQGHLLPKKPYDDGAFVDFLHELAGRKIDIYITELDVDDSSFADDVAKRDTAVAARYRDFLGAVLSVPAVKMVVTWQLADSASWYYHDAIEADPNLVRRPRPLPFDENFVPKPAYRAMVSAFNNRAV